MQTRAVSQTQSAQGQFFGGIRHRFEKSKDVRSHIVATVLRGFSGMDNNTCWEEAKEYMSPEIRFLFIGESRNAMRRFRSTLLESRKIPCMIDINQEKSEKNLDGGYSGSDEGSPIHPKEIAGT